MTIKEAIRKDTTASPGKRLALWITNEEIGSLDAAAKQIGISRPTMTAALADSGRLQHTSYRKIQQATGIGGWLR